MTIWVVTQASVLILLHMHESSVYVFYTDFSPTAEIGKKCYSRATVATLKHCIKQQASSKTGSMHLFNINPNLQRQKLIEKCDFHYFEENALLVINICTECLSRFQVNII